MYYTIFLYKNQLQIGNLRGGVRTTITPMACISSRRMLCISPTQSVVYLLFVGRTRQMTQDTASGMHQAAGKYTLTRDEIQGRRADLDDMHHASRGDVRSEATD
jgi:hypothetical protein